MPNLYHAKITSLKRSYSNMRWFEKLFFPYQLAFELERYSEQDENNAAQLAVFKAFEKSTWFFHKWFFASLQYFGNFEITKSLHILNVAGLLAGDTAQTNFDAIVANQNPWAVPNALRTLHTAGLLTGDAAQANYDALVAHQHPYRVADALSILDTAGLLTGDAAQANFNAVVVHQQNPQGVADAINTLYAAGLLTGDAAQVNRDAVVAHQDPGAVANALRTLHTAGLLTGDAAQANFNAVVITHTIILLRPPTIYGGYRINLWSAMPYGQPTAAQFQTMIEIAQTHAANPDAGSLALMNYVHFHMLNIPLPEMIWQQNRQQPRLNTTQSTHTASVHASASQTATNLFNRYESRIQGAALNTTLQAFSSWVNAYTPKNLKQQAAARCIRRLRYDLYTDSVSRVSTRQLMALAWLAVHDESARTATLDDAKQQLIEAPYEIQRGYNLSEIGVDDHAPEDHPICTGGTFNKWCEKLSGVHQDAVMLFITHAGAAAKLPIVAREEAQDHLDTLRPGSRDYVTCQEQINQNNLQPLWDMISSTVANRLFNEFGSLYPQGVHSSEFIAFFSQGIYALDNTELTLPAARLAVTPNPHALFQAHEDSPAAQQPENTRDASIG